MNRLLGYAIVALFCASSFAQVPDVDDRRGDYDQAVAFLKSIQADVRNNDATDLAKLVRYPLLATVNGKGKHIHTQKAFIANYRSIFNPATREAFLSCTVNDLWWRDQGYTVGPGILWFDSFTTRGNNLPPVESPDASDAMLILTVNGALEGRGCHR